jgi:hypothetical protein
MSDDILALTHSKLEGCLESSGQHAARCLLGSSAIANPTSDARDIIVKLDVGGFVRRLLMFDTYILYSVRLKEVPELVNHFGFQGTMDLFASGALELRLECAQYIEGNSIQSLAHVWQQYLISCLPLLRQAPLSSRQLMNLQTSVVKAVRRATTVACSLSTSLRHLRAKYSATVR